MITMQKTSKALLLIDFEKEWTNRESDYFVGDITNTIDKTNKLIDFCRSKGYKIIFTRHVDIGSEDAFAEESEGTKLINRLHKKDSDVLITKNKVSSFYKTGLEKELHGTKEIAVCGILTNMCVRHAAEDAYDRDFNITIVKDCCVALDEDTQEFTFKDLKATRPEIEILDLKEFLKKEEK